MSHVFLIAYAVGMGASMFTLTELLTKRSHNAGRISEKELVQVLAVSFIVGWFLWPIFCYWALFNNPFKPK